MFSQKNLTVCAYWYNRPMRGGEFLDQTRLFLEKILHSFPELSTIRVIRDPRESDGIVERDFSNFDREVVEAMPKDWVYLNPDPENKRFTRDSNAATSFRVSFQVTATQGFEDLSIQIMAGSPAGRSSDFVIIEIPPKLESPEFARKLLGLCVEFWRPHHANVGRYEVMKALNQGVGDAAIGWLTYLADQNAQRALANDISVERFFDGVLVQASELPGCLSDVQSIETMGRIFDTLGTLGFLRNPQRKVPVRKGDVGS